MLNTSVVEFRLNEEDNKKLQEYIKREINKQINHQLLLVDVQKLSELTSMSVRFLEEHILPDARVKQFERRRSRKKFYIYDGVMDAILSIVNSWEG